MRAARSIAILGVVQLVLYPLQIALLFALPIALFVALRRRGVARRLVGVGALTFVASQVVHVPLLLGATALAKHVLTWHPTGWTKDLFNAAVLGLFAGVCEEVARWAVLRTWLRDARSFRDAVGFGAGHGGCEALLVALLAAVTFVAMLWLRGGGLAHLHLPPEVADKARGQVETYWSAPAYLPFLAVLERAVALVAQVAMATVVMQCFARGRLWPLALAVAMHAILDGAAVLAIAHLGAVRTELVLAASVPINLGVLAWSRRVLTRRTP